MMTRTIPEQDKPLLRRALDGGIRVLRQLGPYEYEVSSRRPDITHRVWTKGGKANCTCELSSIGRKRCPHGALAAAFQQWHEQKDER